MYAFEHGYKAIREGICDAAIVAGSNLCLHPYVSLQFSRLGVLAKDGKCKCFDEKGQYIYLLIYQNITEVYFMAYI